MDDPTFQERVGRIVELNRRTEGDKQERAAQARALLLELLGELLEKPAGAAALSQLAQVELALGVNHIEANELTAAREQLDTARKHLLELRYTDPADDGPRPQGYTEDRSWDHMLMEIHNMLAVLHSTRGELAEARFNLLVSERIYKANDGDKVRKDLFEEWYMQTTALLADVLERLGERAAACEYGVIHLETHLARKKDLNRPDWVTKCLKLTRLYLEGEDFSLADYCLRAVDKVLAQWEGERDPRVVADFEIAAAKYDSHMLRVSHQRLAANSDVDLVTKPSKKEGLFFLPVPDPIGRLPLVRTFEEAREVFRRAQPRFDLALQHYTIERDLATHISVTADLSTLWRLLSQYDPDPERKVSMHKRRAALLEPLAEVARARGRRDLLRDVLFQLGEVWNDIAEVRQAQLKTGAVAPKKANDAGETCIAWCERFLGTFAPDRDADAEGCPDPLEGTDSSQRPGPQQLQPEDRKPFLMANMHIARQYTQLQSPEYAEAAKWLTAATDRYRYIVDCAKTYGLAEVPELQPTLNIASEVGGRLPTRLRELRQKYGVE